MSKRKADRRSHQPPVPVVAPATWQALLTAADAFGSLAPWIWMHDSELLGLHHPATGEKLLCSILGRLRTLFALLVFRRDTGRRWILETILEAEDRDVPKDPDSGMDQDCLKVEFVPKSELTPEDRAVLSAASFAPSVPRGPVWPAFRSLVPGGYPWYLTQAEAEMLLFALPCVAAFAALCRDTPGLGVDLATGEVPFLPVDFDPASRPLRAAELDWQPQVPAPAPTPLPVTLDDATLARLRALPLAKGAHLELDVFYAPMAVRGAERPYFPKTVMAVDRQSGFIGGVHMAEAGDLEAVASVGKVLAAALQQFGQRPETIRVLRPRLMQMLSPVAARLETPVRQDRELASLSAAREALMQRFGG